jgi:hypothetical protein
VISTVCLRLVVYPTFSFMRHLLFATRRHRCIFSVFWPPLRRSTSHARNPSTPLLNDSPSRGQVLYFLNNSGNISQIHYCSLANADSDGPSFPRPPESSSTAECHSLSRLVSSFPRILFNYCMFGLEMCRLAACLNRRYHIQRHEMPCPCERTTGQFLV